jgi:hypothetical protein
VTTGATGATGLVTTGATCLTDLFCFAMIIYSLS